MHNTVFSSIVFLFIWTNTLRAQQVPFPESNAVWRETHTTIAGPILQFTALCGDTTLNGASYSQVIGLQVDTALNITGATFLGGLRSNGNVVRFLPSSGSPELLLYDFNLEEGDMIDLTHVAFGSTVTRTVDSVGSALLGGKMRKVLYFEPGYQGAPVEFWIEGIGSNFGLLGRAADPFPDFGSALQCFKHGDALLLLVPNDCFLPILPAECALVSADNEVPTSKALKLTAQPNPAGPEIRFSVNQNQLPESCNLRIYSANGKLLGTVADAQPEMNLPNGLALHPGFYIATLESERTERVLAHCTFVVGEP